MRIETKDHMRAIHIIITSTVLAVTACNESRRGNDSNLNEPRNEAAAESNQDKFAGQTQKDAEFTYEVVASNYGEIKLAELANQRSRNTEVKNLAQMLVTDHTTALNELKTFAQAKAISIPVEERETAERKIDNLADKSGEEFDKDWTSEMLDMHEESISKFEDRLESTEDAELKAYISKTLPVLKKHREELEALEENLKQKS